MVVGELTDPVEARLAHGEHGGGEGIGPGEAGPHHGDRSEALSFVVVAAALVFVLVVSLVLVLVLVIVVVLALAIVFVLVSASVLAVVVA